MHLRVGVREPFLAVAVLVVLAHAPWAWGASLVALGDLPGGSFGSGATAVSSDGSVVVGTSSSASGTEAFRWTASSGMVGLGDLPVGSLQSFATGV
jgi:probable HAF family extracellular repeat protein